MQYESGCTFSDPKIDRTMSFYALDRQFGGCLLDANERRIPANSEQFRQRLVALAQSGRLVAPRFGENSDAATNSRHSAATYNEGKNYALNNRSGDMSDDRNVTTETTDAAATVGNIIQIMVSTFVELAVQPHQVRISLGGGGSDRGGWNDKDKEKNEYKPRRRR